MTMGFGFSPDGTLLASAGGIRDKAVYLWDFEAHSLVGVLGGHSAHVGSVAFSPNGKFLASTAYWDNDIYIWDVEAQQQVAVLTGHDASDVGLGDQVAFCPDGTWLASGSENGVELWPLDSPPLHVVDFNGDGVVDLADLVMSIDNWGTDNPRYDIGPMLWGDGVVGVEDLKVFIAGWEKENTANPEDGQ